MYRNSKVMKCSLNKNAISESFLLARGISAHSPPTNETASLGSDGLHHSGGYETLTFMHKNSNYQKCEGIYSL